MKNITLFLALALPLIGFSQNNVTFQVDMNQYSKTAIGQVEILGSFNNWSGDVNILSDANNDGVYDATISIPSGSIEYLFFVDTNSLNEYEKEDFNSTQPFCTTGNPPFVNRVFSVTGDTTLPAVCWESCVNCASTPSNSDVTFQVDMSNYTGSYTDVNLNGTFNNFCGSCAVMTDANNDMIYELTVTVPNDTIQWLFTVDGFTDQEVFTSGDPCTKTTIDGTNTFVNRVFVPSGDTTLPDVCWNYCVDCASIGVEENWISELTIQPNPTNGVITLKGELQSKSNLSIMIYNIQGKLMYQEELNADLLIDHELNLSHLSDGLYMLSLDNGESTVQDKIVITHQ